MMGLRRQHVVKRTRLANFLTFPPTPRLSPQCSFGDLYILACPLLPSYLSVYAANLYVTLRFQPSLLLLVRSYPH